MQSRPVLAASSLLGLLLTAGCASAQPAATPPSVTSSSPAAATSTPATPATPSAPSSSSPPPAKPEPDPQCGGLRVADVAYQVGRPVDARRTASGCVFSSKRKPQLVVQVGRQAIGDVPDGLAGAVQRVRDAMPGATFGTLQLARGGFIGVGELTSSTPIGGLGLAQVRRTLATVSVKQQAVPKRALDDDAVSRLLVGVLALMAGLG